MTNAGGTAGNFSRPFNEDGFYFNGRSSK